MRNIGRYEVQAEIGRGAMGIVCLARDPRLGRRVALKTYVLPPGVTADEEREFRARFEREARAAAALSHPGIVTIHDVERDAGTGVPYIVMEYVEGQSLRDLLARRGRLEPSEACEIARQVADALHAAHAAGIVHRDVKPANILIGAADGRAKLADFGVARRQESDLTRSGAALGSPAYMSPEQLRGGAVDGRSDLFSLGVILYQMLTGSRPFEGDDLAALGYSIVHETPVPVTRRVPGLPAGLGAFVDRALAKSPDGRFADGRAFGEALARAMESREEPPGERTVVQPRPAEPGTRAATAALAADRDGARAVAAGEFALSSGTTGPARATLRDRLLRRLGSSRTVWIGTALALVAVPVALLVWNDPAYIELHGRSTIPAGKLTLFIDGREVYRRDLAFSGERGSLTKLFDKLRPASGGETFEAVIEAPPGRRVVEAVVAEPETAEQHRSSVVVDLEDGATEKLRLIAGRSNRPPVSLKRD